MKRHDVPTTEQKENQLQAELLQNGGSFAFMCRTFFR